MKIFAFSRVVLCCLLLCFSVTFPQLAKSATLLTYIDGEGILTRGLSRYKISEGISIEKSDIIQLGAQSQAILEFDDGTILGLGPQTSLMILGVPNKPSTNFDVFVLAGQLKSSTLNASNHKFSSPQLSSVVLKNGILVFRQDANVAMTFIEKGEGVSILREPKDDLYSLKNSNLYVARAGQKAEILSRPSAEFIVGLPKMFLDDLPSRKEKFKNTKVQPKKIQDFNYADMEAWLKTSPQIRKILVQKWKTKVNDPIFKKLLIDNLQFHPEWDRILFPEKYQKTHSDNSIWKRLNY